MPARLLWLSPMFESLAPTPPDAILGVLARLRQDPHPHKVDLSVGVYQDDAGNTPVLSSVASAERDLVTEQKTKNYVGILGNPLFVDCMESLVFGENHPARESRRIVSLQTPGGSGGLSVAAHLVARANPGARVWLSDPSWPNHVQLIGLPGLRLARYPYYDAVSRRLDFDAMLARLQTADAGDVVLLHGCCHNPTGTDLSESQWGEVAALCLRRGLTPLVDIAYQGFGESLEADAYGPRVLAEALPEVLTVASCSKTFGLYRDRVGLLSVVCSSEEQAAVARSNLSTIVRSLYSMPPDHGAAIVARVLQDSALLESWRSELAAMRNRLVQLRNAFSERLAAHGAPSGASCIETQRGMFSLLGLRPAGIERLREESHIYVVDSGRMNVAGLTLGNVDRVARAVAAVMPSSAEPPA